MDARAIGARHHTRDITAAARRYRRFWTALRCASLLHATTLGWLLLIAGYNRIAGTTLFGGNEVLLGGMLNDDWRWQLVDVGVFLAAPVVLYCVCRYARGHVALSALLVALIGTGTIATGIEQRNFEDGDIPQIGMIAVVSSAAAAALWLAVRLLYQGNRVSVAGLCTAYNRLVRRRRATYRQFSWGKTYWLAVALATIAALYIATNGLIVRFMTGIVGVPLSTWTSAEQLKRLSDGSPWAVVTISLVSILLLGLWAVLAHFIWRAAWRRVRRSAEDVIGDSDYRPVLFLRSFQDENARVRPKRLFTLLARRRPRLEEVLVRSVSKLGPAVAIGLPGERLPPLGAMRAYYADADWQKAVLDWMTRAYAIVMIGGASSWLLWELGEVLRRGLAGRLLLILPPDVSQEERARRWQSLEAAIAGTPWHAAFRALDPHALLCIVFLRDGQVHGVAGSARHEADYELAVQVAMVAAVRQPRRRPSPVAAGSARSPAVTA